MTSNLGIMAYIYQVWKFNFPHKFFWEKHSLENNFQLPGADRSDRLARPVWPVMPGSYLFYPFMGKTVKILFHSPSTDTPSPSYVSLMRTRRPHWRSRVSTKEKAIPLGIWITPPAWLLSQAGPSISPSKSHSKGTLWIVLSRSTYLGHRFKTPLVEHLLPHPRTCS